MRMWYMMLVEVGFVTYCPVEIYVLLKSAPSHCGVEYVLQYPLHRAGSDLVYALDLCGAVESYLGDLFILGNRLCSTLARLYSS